MLQISFLHCAFLLKKKKNISFNKIQLWFLYLILVKKANFFFLLVLQRFSRTLVKEIKLDAFFDFRFKIPSKIIFNLILIEMVNLVKCLGVIKGFKFYNFCKNQTRFSLLRSPFVFKKSQEQLVVDRYTGSFCINLAKNSFLISEYIEIFIVNGLKKICLLDTTVLRYLKTI
jgi:hypothetical protein